MSHQGRANGPVELIWDCLNRTILTNDDDLIGLDNLKGIEVHLDRGSQTLVDFRVDDLDSDNVHPWLERDAVGRVPMRDRLKLKLLLGDQAVAEDTLRPPVDAQAERFSRKCIHQDLGSPPVALETMSRRSPWMLEFPRDPRDGHSVCYGIGTSDFSLVWSLRAQSCIRAMLVVFRGPVPGPRDFLVDTLKRLGPLADLPSYLPLSLLQVAIPTIDRRISKFKTEVRNADVEILRLQDMRVANSIFGSAHTLSGANAAAGQDARNLLKLAETVPNIPQKHHRDHAGGSRREFQAKNKEFNNVSRFCRNYLEILVGEAVRNQEDLTRQLETIQQQLSIKLSRDQHELAQAARREQEVSTEIAKASRDIATETKKDGQSMKTLSVVTMLFLPATTMSSIFAMPLFDWGARHGGAVVNPRIWVYVVSALLVTALTVGSWWLWLWQGPRRKDREKRANASVKVPGDQNLV